MRFQQGFETETNIALTFCREYLRSFIHYTYQTFVASMHEEIMKSTTYQ